MPVMGLSHTFGTHAEQVGGAVGPPAFRLVISGNANQGEVLLGNHAGANSGVGGGDMSADNRHGLLLANEFGVFGEHDTCP